MAPNVETAVDGGGSAEFYNDDDVVISGISGRFPNCDSFEDFKRKLFDGTDIHADGESRWPDGVGGAVTKIGVVKNLTKFDSTFFNVHAKLAEKLDPQIRCMLESTYEAFVDAGLNPTAMRGSNTAVIVGTTNNDSADWWSSDPKLVNGYDFLGCTRTMFPNRISYSFDLKGPSYAIDSGSSGSLLAFEHAYRMLKRGVVDGAIVAGCSMLLNPVISVMMQKINCISPDGQCKPFDASGQGSARSDAVVILYMQLAKDAKRIYATAVNAATNTEGFRMEGPIYPTNDQQIVLFKEVLDNAKIGAQDVDYIESSASGHQLCDAQELNAVTEVYCKNRTKPLLIGSVKSNMGDSEPASGLCGVVKMVLAMENQEIPPTLHYSSPNPSVPALKDGRLQVVNKSLPWKGQYAAVNAVGIGGHNAQALLKAYEKSKTPQPKETIPRLVVGSARTESAINYMLNKIEAVPRDPEYYGLLYGVQSQNIPGHLYRGYSVLGEENNREVAVLGAGKRETWYVFSGMGSQWTGMGRDLLELPPFRESIEKTASTLKTLGLDLYAVFNSNDKTVFDNVLNSFVGIAAIQIALVDVLTAVGITPDGIVGHSVGELACAYADGTLTAEQTIVVAYWRGRSLLDLNLAPGAMAAVGLSWEEANARVPSDIAVACHNSEDGVTISGPPDSIANFVNKLKSEGVFAREVNSSGVAFHSWYIAAAGPVFKEKVSGIIANPKARSPRWISTSIPESRWNEPLAQYSSVAYHVNNLVSPVLFNSALKHVPDNSVVIEIAPHALLQAILKPSVGSQCTHVGLVRRNQSTVSNLLASIGKLFNAGLQPKLENLYPPIDYPVSRGTPSLQPLVEWDHTDDWEVVTFIETEVKSSGEVTLEVDVEKESYSYLRGTYVDGVEVLPYASYLTFVWKALAKLQLSSVDKTPVVFDNVQFIRNVPVPVDGKIVFVVNILAGTGEFEIRESDSVVVSGFVNVQKSDEQMQLPELKSYEVDQLSTSDVYRDLACKGFKYSKSFQTINLANNNGNWGHIAFDGNWTTFLESLFQLHLLNLDTRDHYAIKYLFKLNIDPEKQNKALSSNGVSFNVYENIGLIKSGGVEIRDVRSVLVSVRKELEQNFDLESYIFVPFMPEEAVSRPVDHVVQIVLENASEPFDIAEVVTVQKELLILEILKLTDAKSPFPINANVYAKDVNRYQSGNSLKYFEQDVINSGLEQQVFLVIANGAVENIDLLENLLTGIKNGGFLLTVERNFDSNFKRSGLDVVAKYSDGRQIYVLIKKNTDTPTPIVLPIRSSAPWVESLKSNVQNAVKDDRDVFIVSQNLENTGVIGLTKSLRREPNGKFVKCVSIKDNKAPAFSVSAPLYQTQLKKGLAVNMFLNGVWGTCSFVPYEQGTIQVEHAFINTTRVGDINSLRFIEGKLSTIDPKQYPDYELCYPYYVPLNGLDVKFVNGTLPYNGISADITQQGSYLGMEFSGRDSRGRRVIGLVAGGALATSVLVHKDLIWQIPNEWSLEEACTVPRTFSLAYYALAVRGNIQPGETVYVHAGASGISTASIAVALELGATPYVGVFNREQKLILKSMFPQLNDSSFADLSENGGFEQHLLEQTEGEGVDLIFDTYSVYSKRQEFVNSLAEYGRFVDFEVFAPVSDSLGVSGNLKSITYHKITLSTVHFSPDEIKRVQQLVGQGIRSNRVRPLETTVFPVEQVVEAFEYNKQCSVNIGRTVVEIRSEEATNSGAAVPAKKSVAALPKLFFSPEKSFIVCGDDESLSLELIQYLANRGARKIVLVSKRKTSSGYKALTLRRLKDKNVTVTVSFSDPSKVKGTEDLLREALALGPVSGIYYISTAPETGHFQSLTENDFAVAKNSVSEAVANLDTLSRRLAPHLEYFVVLAPSVASRGAKAKSDYVFANSDICRIAEVRKISGYPAVILEYGAIDGSSAAFNSPKFAAASIVSALNVLDNVTKRPQNPTVVSFSKYNGPSVDDSSADAATPVLMTIAKIFGFKDLSEINQTYSLAQLGLDTLLAPRVLEAIQQQANASVNVEDLRRMTFSDLRAKINGFLA